MKRLVLLVAIGAALAALSIPAAAQPSSLHVLVLLGYYTDTQPLSLTPAQAYTDWQANVGSEVGRESYGLTATSGEGHGWYQVPCASTACRLSDIANGLQAAAQADGVDTASFDHFIYVMSGGVVGSCGGVACATGTLDHGSVWGGPSVATDTSIGMHEFGHAIGFTHGGMITNIGDTPTSGIFDSVEGGGTAAAGWDGSERIQDGWITPTLVTGSGVWTIPVLQSGPGELRVQRGDGSVLDVEDGYYGVTVHYLASPYIDPDGFNNLDPCGGSVLQAGHYWYDAAARILVTNMVDTSTAATVQVDVNHDPPPPQACPPPPPPPPPVCHGHHCKTGRGA